MATEVGAAYLRLLPSLLGFAAQVSKDLEQELLSPIDKKSREAGKRLGDGVVQGLKSAGSKMASAGKSMTLGLTLPLLGFGAAAFKASADFNKAMANVATLIPGNAKRIDQLKQGVRELAVTTGVSTTDMAQGLYQVLSAFGNTKDSLKVLTINAKAAAAGLATTTDAINLTSAVTKGYGDTTAKAVQKVSDLALLTVRLGQTTFPELAGAIGAVVPVAKSLNVSQRELFATMATFTGVTGGASEVATQLRGALQFLMAPTNDGAKALKAAGFASGEAAVKARGLYGAIKILTDASVKTKKPLQNFVGSIEGQILALGLAGAQSQDYQSKLRQMGKTVGVTDAAFKEITSGVNKAGFSWEQAKVKANVLMQELGDALAPALGAVLDFALKLVPAFKDVVSWFNELPGPVQKVATAMAFIVGLGGPFLLILGGVAAGLGAVTTGIFAVGGALSWLGFIIMRNPVGFLITVLVGVVAGLVMLEMKTKVFSRIFKAVWNGIKIAVVSVGNAIAAAWKWLSARISDFGNFVGRIVGKVINFFKSIPSKVKAFFSSIPEAIKAPFRAGFNAIAGLWNNTVGRISFTIPSWIPVVGGKQFSVPKIPTLAEGGIIKATPGGVLALVGEGGQDEAVIPLDRMGSVVGDASAPGAVKLPDVNVYFETSGGEQAVLELIRTLVRKKGRGGNVQLAFGRS